MDFFGDGAIPPTNYCEWCSNIGTSRCGRCHSAFYCCRDHQVRHWSIHKEVCNKTAAPAPTILNSPASNTSGIMDAFQPYGVWSQNNLACENASAVPTPTRDYGSASCAVNEDKSMEFPTEDEIFSSLSSELLSSDNNFWDVINTGDDTQNLFDCGMYFEKDKSLDGISNTFPDPRSSVDDNRPCDDNSDYSMQCAPLNDICANVVNDLNTYGICVLDKFIGSRYGNMILEEVKNLYMQGIFQKGELVNPNPFLTEESVRQDVTTWVNGTEQGCKCIGNLMRKLDVVVTTCNKMLNNGLLSQYKLHRRTKAMIACYPGDGTYYKKHIDNPHKDGRCITCIYYLNQNWDVKQHGGLLRMFPSVHSSHVANIEPIFDRMLFFWSDKRNPHEVLPSYATRFAITVWYFDADERDQALLLSRDRVSMKSN